MVSSIRAAASGDVDPGEDAFGDVEEGRRHGRDDVKVRILERE